VHGAVPHGADTHPPLASHPLAAEAVEAALAGIAAVEPTPLVRRAVRQGLLDDWLGDRARPRRIHVLAVGKGAPRMLWGLVEASVPFTGVGVAPAGVMAPGVDTFEWLAGEHPLPGAQSFAAGRRVLAWARDFPKDEPLLVLLSGGSSAILESPGDGWTEASLAARWRELFRQGLPVEEMNRLRAETSALKGGRLARVLLARTGRIQTWLIQDTEPGHPEAVGSEAFWAPGEIPLHVLASNHDLVAAAGLRLAAGGWTVFRHGERIRGPAEPQAEAFVAALAGLEGERVALVGGGEPTVRLPPEAPPGGRNQHAALAAARALARQDLDGALFAAVASDGIDGTTKESGAWTLSSDWTPEAEAAVAGAGASPFLAARGRTIRLGPTGTNVNDLWVGLRP
jgi:glycerate 2-kinase